MHARSRIALQLALATGLVLSASPAQAQQSLAARTPPADVSAPRATAGPTLDAAAVAVRQPVSQDLTLAAQQRRAGYGRPVALMVVGGAALLAGLIINNGAGTAIAVGGAVIGLYGLYEYLQ